jgi:GR25 family glycosyltransferase involved in LPS biosynthesis
MIHYYLIHCKEHEERNNHINKIKKNLCKSLMIIPGYYTKRNNLDKQEQLKYLQKFDYNLEFKNEFSFKLPGQIGCYLSHHMLIKKILEFKYYQKINNDYSVILEDDVIWYKINLHESINSIINHLSNTDWDIVFLGNLNNNYGKSLKENIYYLDIRKPCFGTHALLINNKKLDKIYRNNCLIRHEIDSHYKILMDGNKLNGFVIYPPLCYQNDVLISNIKI